VKDHLELLVDSFGKRFRKVEILSIIARGTIGVKWYIKTGREINNQGMNSEVIERSKSSFGQHSFDIFLR